MKALILFTAVIGTFGVPKSAIDPTLFEERIVGGYPASEGQFPFQVALKLITSSMFCGGSILDTLHILSAAHCNIAQNDQAEAGIVDITNGGIGLQSKDIEDAVDHPSFNPATAENDITVVTVSTEFTFNSYVSAVFLPTTHYEDYASGSLCTASGWGSTYTGSPLSTNLLYTNLNVVDDQTCSSTWAGLRSSMLCAYGVDKDTCQGDSGGPLVEGYIYGADYTGTKQIGITSFGAEECAAAGVPSIYTQVSYYLDWIAEQVKNCPACGYMEDPSSSCGYIDCITSASENCPVGLCFNPSSCYCEGVRGRGRGGRTGNCPECGFEEDPGGSCGFHDCRDPNSTPSFGQCPAGLCFNPNSCYCEAN